MMGPVVGMGVGGTGLLDAFTSPPKDYRSAHVMASGMSQATVTSEALVKDSLKSIANIDQGLQGGNAFLEVNPDAREQARARDLERANGNVRGFCMAFRSL